MILPEAELRGALVSLDGRTLRSGEDVPGLDAATELVVLLVPDAEGRSRPALMRSLDGRDAVVGPARPWAEVHDLLRAGLPGAAARARPPRGRSRWTPSGGWPTWCSGPTARRWPTCAPACWRRSTTSAPGAREKLAETLRAWLLHHGRREQVAAELFVHPQTVRYRMGQLRELYGKRLEDPRTVLELTIALGLPTTDR